MTTTHGVQTTEERARAAADGRHLIKRYDGEVAWVGRYASPAAAQAAMDAEIEWHRRFRAQYEDVGLVAPARPWEFELV
jgi:hypothetical protein